jgi:hypothetical protein
MPPRELAEYHKPATLDEALSYCRTRIKTVPGQGTGLVPEAATCKPC